LGDNNDIIAYRVVKEATVDPELIDALNEFARLGQDTDADQPLAVGDLVKHARMKSPVMRVWDIRAENITLHWWDDAQHQVIGGFRSGELVRV
jgi:hypothetical protein